jgi:diguanylate cyclase (GGDEF)-like protein
LKSRLSEEHQRQFFLARHDPLTGLANRLGLADYLNQALREADANATKVVVGVLDLDDFKQVNDTWGHEAGDQLLRQVADRLRQAVGPDNLAARLGGDEFVLVVTDAGDGSAVDTRWAAIQEAFEGVTFPDGSVRPIGLSIGLTRYPDDAGDPDGLLRHADIALYRVKSQKSRRSVWWQWWTPGQDG